MVLHLRKTFVRKETNTSDWILKDQGSITFARRRKHLRNKQYFLVNILTYLSMFWQRPQKGRSTVPSCLGKLRTFNSTRSSKTKQRKTKCRQRKSKCRQPSLPKRNFGQKASIIFKHIVFFSLFTQKTRCFVVPKPKRTPETTPGP